MKHFLKMAVTKRSEINAIARTLSANNVLVNAKTVDFNRPLTAAQPDEKVRFDAIYPTEIALYYTAQTVDEALISSQFLDDGEPTSKNNRELFVRLAGFESVNYEIASENGSYLGFLAGLENSKLLIAQEIMGGKRVLILTFPDYGEADLYGYDPNEGIYLYGTTVPMLAVAA